MSGVIMDMRSAHEGVTMAIPHAIIGQRSMNVVTGGHALGSVELLFGWGNGSAGHGSGSPTGCVSPIAG